MVSEDLNGHMNLEPAKGQMPEIDLLNVGSAKKVGTKADLAIK